MVQSESSNNDSSAAGEPPAHHNPAKGVPVGKYQLVGWAIDTTGRRLIDEVIQIAIHTSKSQFSQYIMPFGDIQPVFKYKHQLTVVNADYYRMLKNMQTNKYVKTKSEISALTDFVTKLEEESQGDASDGIILVYHEIRKTYPGMILEALTRCNLIDRFSKVVKGFANSFDIARAKCNNITKAFNLRVLSRVLLNKDEEFTSAVDRARAAYDISIHLAQGEREDLDKPTSDSTGTESHLIELVCPFTNPISTEQQEIADLKILLQRQNTFKPVFGAFLRASRVERQHASHLRKLLAENNINYEKLKAAYETGAKEGLDKVLKAEVANAKEKDLDELLEILDCFFDPEKKAVRPKNRYPPQNNNRRPQFARRPFYRKKNKSASESSPNVSSDNPTNTASTETTPRSDTAKDVEKTEEDQGNAESPVKTEVNVQQDAVAVQ